MSWTACDTAVDLRPRLRLALQSTARSNWMNIWKLCSPRK